MTLSENAKQALERVCSGRALEEAPHYYAPSFVDHVNGLAFHGLPGIERSVKAYRALLRDLVIRVEDQLVESDRVASRFVVEGTCYGRRVQFGGVTISRFENGLIVEDWSVIDTAGMIRQAGIARTLLLGISALYRLGSR